ncbi:MAG TPA: LuxR C-terminal-related transcriptional regulator [Rubrobacter sp.]|nr:LuxR C-terminal-related transcriptional regulator [Rubrobacter sp.]
MPRLSLAQREARQRIGQLAGSGMLPERLASELLAALHQAIPSDDGGLVGLDPTTLLHNRLLAVAPGSWTRINNFYRSGYLSDPVAALLPPAQLRAGLPMLVLHRQLERSLGLPPSLLRAVSEVEEYRAFYADTVSAGGVLRAAFGVDGRWIAWLELIRRSAAQPFGRGDIGFLRLMATAIGQALRAAFDRERAAVSGAGKAGPEASGVLMIAANGREQFRTPAADTWLDLLRRSEAGSDRELPGAVSAAVAALRAGLDGARHATVRAWTLAGPLRVEAAPGDDRGAVSVVLTLERPSIPPELPVVWPMTQAERRVLELLVRGLSNRELAIELNVSVNTIQTHLSHAYEKLGVHNRSQLLARFFQETYWPTMHRSE